MSLYDDILKALVGIGQESGIFASVIGHEPTSAPALEDSLTLALFGGPIAPIESSGLASASMRWMVSGRVYLSAFLEPADDIDPRLLDAGMQFMTSVAGQFTLGGLVRCVDFFGMDGDGLKVTPGYIEHDRKIYRIAELEIPLLLNDVMTLAP